MVAAQEAQVDPCGVGEQHEDERDLGETVNQAVVEPEVGKPEHGIADEQTEGGEHQRWRDNSTFQPLGEQRERDDARGDGGKAERIH